MKKIIYDFGANIGDNLNYYLKKADLTVAVEANPSLIALMQDKFKDSIENGTLILLNYVLNTEDSTDPVPFYIHKKYNVLSQFSPPY